MDAPVSTAPDKRPQIALLEDDPGVRRSLQLLLRGRGFDVKAFGNANSLLADPEVAAAACLVIDYRLPAVDGITVLESLRARDWTGPAILMTAFGTAEITRRAKTAGFCEVFDKPLREHILVATLERLTTSGPAPNHRLI